MRGREVRELREDLLQHRLRLVVSSGLGRLDRLRVGLARLVRLGRRGKDRRHRLAGSRRRRRRTAGMQDDVGRLGEPAERDVHLHDVGLEALLGEGELPAALQQPHAHEAALLVALLRLRDLLAGFAQEVHVDLDVGHACALLVDDLASDAARHPGLRPCRRRQQERHSHSRPQPGHVTHEPTGHRRPPFPARPGCILAHFPTTSKALDARRSGR